MLLIYRAHDDNLNGAPCYTSKAIKVQLRMALDLDRDMDGILQNNVCFPVGNRTLVAKNDCRLALLHFIHPVISKKGSPGGMTDTFAEHGASCSRRSCINIFTSFHFL